MTTIYVLLVVAPTRLVSSRPGYSKRTVQTQSIEFEQKTLCVAQRSYLLEIHREVGGARLSGEFLQVPTVPYLLTSYHLLSSSGGGGLYVAFVEDHSPYDYKPRARGNNPTTIAANVFNKTVQGM